MDTELSIVEFYKTNSVEESFDEKFYQNAHPDSKNFYQPFCSDSGIDDRHRLYYHYYLYGKNFGFVHNLQDVLEHELVPLQVDKDCKKYLFTTYYKDNRRQHEIDYCLEKNITNEHIKHVYALVTTGTERPDFLSRNPKITFINIETKTPTYKDWILSSKSLIKDDNYVSIFCNADIHFDYTVDQISSFTSRENSIVCLSRYDRNAAGEYKIITNPKWSQDTWALSGDSINKIDFVHSLGIPTGKPRCDNKIAYKFAYNGFDIFNPCYHIKSYHKHKEGHRNYNMKTDAALGAVCFIEPCINPNYPSKKNYVLAPRKVTDTIDHVVMSDFLSTCKFKNFKAILSDNQKRHLHGGWGSVNEQIDRVWTKDRSNNLITFLWESYQSHPDKLWSSNWYAVEHLVNYCPQYYGDVLPLVPTIESFYEKLHESGVLEEQCEGILFTSEHTFKTNNNLLYLQNKKLGYVHHPIMPDISCKKFSVENYLNNKDKKLINLGWFNRNFSFFEKLTVDGFEKLFVFGGVENFKYKIFENDMIYNGISNPTTVISPSLTDNELNELLSNNIIFVNLYDSSANNAIINAVQRHCPIILNRLPACEEYLGSEYPLFYDESDEIKYLLMEEKIIEAHYYLRDLDISKFSIDNFISTVNEFIGGY